MVRAEEGPGVGGYVGREEHHGSSSAFCGECLSGPIWFEFNIQGMDGHFGMMVPTIEPRTVLNSDSKALSETDCQHSC